MNKYLSLALTGLHMSKLVKNCKALKNANKNYNPTYLLIIAESYQDLVRSQKNMSRKRSGKKYIKLNNSQMRIIHNRIKVIKQKRNLFKQTPA